MKQTAYLSAVKYLEIKAIRLRGHIVIPSSMYHRLTVRNVVLDDPLLSCFLSICANIL